jgi:3-oxoacyl-[acyl-carrier protein] reductase
MSDYLLQISKNPAAKNAINQLGLPVPMPQPLERERRPYPSAPLEGRRIVLHGSPDSELLHPTSRGLLRAGATVLAPEHVAELEGLLEESRALAGELVELEVDGLDDGDDVDGLVLDATTCKHPEELDRLYEFFHPRLRSMNRCGRAVVLARPDQATDAAATAAAQRGIEGFTRSLAREVGRFGQTANLLVVEEGAEERIDRPLRFLTTPRSAYVSAQRIELSADTEPHPDADRDREVLADRTALVTGAAGGIGSATVRRLADEGATVLAVDLPGSDRLQKLDREVDAIPLPLDLTDDDAPDRLAQAASENGGLDILVHSAGITRDRTLVNMARDAWRQSLAVNVEAPIRVTRRLLDDDLVADHGRILCLSSIAGIAGNVCQSNYATGKAGLIGFVRKLADDLADRSITANAVAPGFIETQMTDEMPVVIREVARRMNALSQGGRPIDVANALTFLASPGAQPVSGQVLRVCGAALAGA